MMLNDINQTKIWEDRRKAEHDAVNREDLNKWRYVIYDGKAVHSYSDPALTNVVLTRSLAPYLSGKGQNTIADFGAGDGWVGLTVCQQLSEINSIQASSVGIDRDPQALSRMKRCSPDVLHVIRDLLDLRLPSRSFDAGILRFALTFIKQEQQPKVFEQIYQVMKDGAVLAVWNDGVMDEGKKAEAWNDLLAHCLAFDGENRTVQQIKATQYLPSCARTVQMAKRAGFTVETVSDLSDCAFGYLSPEMCTKTFGLNTDQSSKLRTEFEKCKEQGVLDFEPDRASLRVLWPMYSCVLRKEACNP